MKMDMQTASKMLGLSADRMTPEQILSKNYSTEFDDKRKNRMVVSHYKYGPAWKTYPELADSIACLEQRLKLYKETGNKEHLVDVANFAMIEYMFPRHPNAHFRATDSNESPGLVGTSYNELMQEVGIE
jgi:hypothetical protein